MKAHFWQGKALCTAWMLSVILQWPVSTSAQSTIPKVKNDSLWAVWNDVSKHDTMRILAMKDISWDGYLLTQPRTHSFMINPT